MPRSFVARVAVLTTALLAPACSLDHQSIPTATGPSEFGLSVRSTATPQLLPRDGASQAVIVIEVTDADRKPAAGQRLLLSSTAGSLSASEVSTGSDGRATVRLTAPPVNQGVDTAEIEATPVGLNGQSSESRSVITGWCTTPSFLGTSTRCSQAGNPFDTSFCQKPFASIPCGYRSIVSGRPRR